MAAPCRSRAWPILPSVSALLRQGLGHGRPLALWLHGFYATHAKPYPLTVAYLHKLSGSQTKQLKHFKQNLTQALRDLQAVGAIEAFEIVGDLVHVRTVPSKSQQKHLAARRPPARQRK